MFVYDFIARVDDALGPGARAVVWVAGCSLACPGCMVPETWSRRTANRWVPADLASHLLQEDGLDGLTVSGGEPTEQPEDVAVLLETFKRAGKNTWVYSGRTIEELVGLDDPHVDRLLAATDVLVDGRFVREKAGSFRLRGSSNQRIIHLSDAIPTVIDNGTESSRVQIRVDEEGRLTVVGIPPPGFLPQLREKLDERGIGLKGTIGWR